MIWLAKVFGSVISVGSGPQSGYIPFPSSEALMINLQAAEAGMAVVLTLKVFILPSIAQ
jgi:hypothetical protein